MRLIHAALSLACLCTAARAGVLVLDAAGGGDFVTLQEVAAGAADGDIVLVRPGSYASPRRSPGVAFAGKTLTIVADGLGSVDVGPIRVAGVPAGKTFVLRGLRLVNGTGDGSAGTRLLVEESQGAVIVEDCVIGSAGDENTLLPTTAVSVVSSNLSLKSCTIVAAAGGDFSSAVLQAQPGDCGLQALGSHVALSGCVVRGGAGGDELEKSPVFGAGAGGPALVSLGSQLQISGCDIAAGAGGRDTGTPLAGGASAGGTGLLADGHSLVHIRGSAISGGAGGNDEDGAGARGPAIDAPAAAIVRQSGAARTLRVGTPLVEGGSSEVVIGGEPGELVALLLALAGAWIEMPKLGGPLLVDRSTAWPLFLGVLGPSGSLAVSFTAPPLGLETLSGRRVLAQVVALSGSALVLGEVSVFVEVPALP